MSKIRAAQHADIPALHSLIALSGRALSVGYYSPQQADGMTRYVFGVDTQLIDDQTYFVIEHEIGLLPVAVGAGGARFLAATRPRADRIRCWTQRLSQPASVRSSLILRWPGAGWADS